jgi:hypothetical protein
MSIKNHRDENQPDVPSESDNQSTNLSRRKFAKIGVIAAPAIMTLASRPAIAAKNFCSVSGWGSVNPSGRPDDYVCYGRSPGYWGTYWSSSTAGDWSAAGFDPGPTNPLSFKKNSFLDDHDYSVPTVGELDQAVIDGILTTEEKEAYIAEIQAAATLDTLMGTAPGTWSTSVQNLALPIDYPTVMMIFNENTYKRMLGNGNEAFHYSASLLNAARWGLDYGYTLNEMRNLISTRHGTIGFVEDLESLYDRGA